MKLQCNVVPMVFVAAKTTERQFFIHLFFEFGKKKPPKYTSNIQFYFCLYFNAMLILIVLLFVSSLKFKKKKQVIYEFIFSWENHSSCQCYFRRCQCHQSIWLFNCCCSIVESFETIKHHNTHLKWFFEEGGENTVSFYFCSLTLSVSTLANCFSSSK